MNIQIRKLNEKSYYIEKIKILLEKLGVKTDNLDNYLLAFIHRSLVNERPDFSKNHNERLEFLGDAVLELAITKNLFNDYPETPEGELTDYRSSIVKGKNLAKISRELELNEYLILGRGEELGGGRENDYLLANCLEAFLGALYLDLGFVETENFILKYVYPSLKKILNNDELKDYKSLLQEYTQRVFFITPEYKVLEESGLDHEKDYVSGVFLRETIIGKGNGSSKKKSQESAARDAFLNKENIFLPGKKGQK